jgi:hypothetical protein
MSGRVWTTLANGRRVRGFRKTLRENPRLAREQRPEMRMTSILPVALGAFVSPGRHGFGIEILPGAVLVVTSWSRDHLVKLAVDFIGKVAAHLLPLVLPVAIARKSEAGAWQPAGGYQLTIKGRDTKPILVRERAADRGAG